MPFFPEQVHLAVSGVQDGQADAGEPAGAAAAPEGHRRAQHRERDRGAQERRWGESDSFGLIMAYTQYGSFGTA